MSQIIQPEITMSRDWWHTLASVHQLTMNRVMCGTANLAKFKKVSQNTLINKMHKLRAAKLVEVDKKEIKGREFNIYFLTDYGYKQLAAFCEYVDSEDTAQDFYSRSLKKVA